MSQSRRDEPESEPTSGAAPVVSGAIAAAVSGLGDLAGVHGHHEANLALKSIAPLVAYSVDRGFVWVGRQRYRAEEFIRSLRGRAEAEGIADELSEAADLIEQAIPIIGTEPAEEKRRLIESIILNGARFPGKKSQGLRALEMLETLPLEAALVFGAILAARQKGGQFIILADAEKRAELPRFLFDWGLSQLWTSTHNFVEYPMHPDGQGREWANKSLLRLTEQGDWLAKWLEEHPPATEVEAEPS